MDDAHKIPDPVASQDSSVPGDTPETLPVIEPSAATHPPRMLSAGIYVPQESFDEITARRRSFRHNLFILLGLTLTAFILTAWILVRVDSPFGFFSSGPQELVRAQLRALDHGELRPAYDMF